MLVLVKMFVLLKQMLFYVHCLFKLCILEKGEAPKGKKRVSRHLSSLELLIRMVGGKVSGQSIKKCHKIFLSSQLFMSRNVFEITLLCINVFRGVKQFVAEFCV